MYIFIYHVFFIHSSVNGPLGNFHVLTFVNTSVMNIRVCVPFKLEFSLDICLEAGFLGHMAILISGFFFFFKGISILFFIVPIYFFGGGALSLQNPGCELHSQYISIQTGVFQVPREPHRGGGPWIRQSRRYQLLLPLCKSWLSLGNSLSMGNWAWILSDSDGNCSWILLLPCCHLSWGRFYSKMLSEHPEWQVLGRTSRKGFW